jgi:aspartyl-tRNA(Asn)/glutamyl-tRNA(Gln) amidotransferase subunit C
MPLVPKQVQHIASLAHVNLSPLEADQLTRDLTAILKYFNEIRRVAGDLPKAGKPAISHAALRADTVRPGLERKLALENAPNHDGEFILVPRTIS